ncbi:hypothetical protein AB3S75_013172 [Citrus x aurantiifolia]
MTWLLGQSRSFRQYHMKIHFVEELLKLYRKKQNPISLAWPVHFSRSPPTRVWPRWQWNLAVAFSAGEWENSLVLRELCSVARFIACYGDYILERRGKAKLACSDYDRSRRYCHYQ